MQMHEDFLGTLREHMVHVDGAWMQAIIFWNEESFGILQEGIMMRFINSRNLSVMDPNPLVRRPSCKFPCESRLAEGSNLVLGRVSEST